MAANIALNFDVGFGFEDMVFIFNRKDYKLASTV
jgi:hypothetical protein